MISMGRRMNLNVKSSHTEKDELYIIVQPINCNLILNSQRIAQLLIIIVTLVMWLATNSALHHIIFVGSFYSISSIPFKFVYLPCYCVRHSYLHTKHTREYNLPYMHTIIIIMEMVFVIIMKLVSHFMNCICTTVCTCYYGECGP